MEAEGQEGLEAAEEYLRVQKGRLRQRSTLANLEDRSAALGDGAWLCAVTRGYP